MEKPTVADAGKWMRARRERLGLSRLDLSFLARVDVSVIAQIEMGTVSDPWAILVKIERALEAAEDRTDRRLVHQPEERRADPLPTSPPKSSMKPAIAPSSNSSDDDAPDAGFSFEIHLADGEVLLRRTSQYAAANVELQVTEIGSLLVLGRRAGKPNGALKPGGQDASVLEAFAPGSWIRVTSFDSGYACGEA